MIKLNLNDLKKLVDKLNKFTSKQKLDSKLLKKIEADLGKLGEDDLDSLHAAHINTLSDRMNEIFTDLPEEHPIKTLALEHEEMMYLLDELELVNEKVQNTKTYENMSKGLKTTLNNVVMKLKETNTHDLREELVIFEEFKQIATFYKLKIMEEEHKKMRENKDKLLELIESNISQEFDKFKKNFGILTDQIVKKMSYHIYKENNLIYPSVLALINKDEDWKRIKVKCDEIGYGCFTNNCQITSRIK